MPRILIVDDQPQIGELLKRAFAKDGYDVTVTSEPESGLLLLEQRSFDVLITDLRMPGVDGIEMLRRCREIQPRCAVVLITAYATVGTVRMALKLGAIDYMTKPFSIEGELRPLIRSVLSRPQPPDAESASAAEGVRWSPAWKGETDPFDGIVRESFAMREVIDRAKRVASADVPVLLRGESGTGKGVVAQLIHRCSPRRHMPMVIVNCAALPDTLLESELFGSAKGAFTGSTADRPGFFEVANGGTIFLDEIGEVSASFQPKLLRVIETGEFNRLGDAKRASKVDVRIIAATNRNLEDAIDSGAFRADLYYRLNVVPIVMPTMRSRMEDLPELIAYFLGKHGEERRFSDDALRNLMAYDWPGNVREVANAVEHALVLSEGSLMQTFDLPAAIQNSALARPEAWRAGREKDDTLEGVEIRSILDAMEKAEYNRTKAAQLLGVTRRTLGYRIEKYGLAADLESKRESPEPARTRVARVRRKPARPLPKTSEP